MYVHFKKNKWKCYQSGKSVRPIWPSKKAKDAPQC